MSNVEKLIALGADAVGGELIWKHKVLGHFRHGDFFITPEGEAALNIEDVVFTEVKPAAPAPAPVAPKAVAKKMPKPVPKPAPEPEPEVEGVDLDDLPVAIEPANLDDLLGD